MKKQTKTNKSKIYIVSGVIAGLIAFVALIFVLNPINPTTEAESSRNRQLISEATDTRNMKLCDQISGGLLEIKGTSGTTTSDYLAVEGRPRSPAMSESEAKDECKDNVNYQIRHQEELRKESIE